MNKERNDHNLTVSEITLQMRLRDIILLVTVAGSLGYVLGAALPHLLFLEHINIALGVFILFGMLFLVGFILLFFEPILFPCRPLSHTPNDQKDITDTNDIVENMPREASTQMPTNSSDEMHASKTRDVISNIYELQSKEMENLGLTEQESIVAHLLLRGDKYKDIAEQMVLSENTIKYHVRNVYKKAHVRSRQDLKKLIWSKINVKVPPESTN